MLRFEPLTLDKKGLFDSYVAGRGYMQSESSFANLYIWAEAWEIRMATDEDALYLLFNSDTYRPFLIPPFPMDAERSVAPCMDRARDAMMAEYGEFYMKCATGRMVNKIKHDCPGRYIFRYDESNSEYVYNTKDLLELAGKRYHGKRNHINSFLRAYYPAVADYVPKYRQECLALQDAWAKYRDVDPRDVAEEHESIRRVVDHYETLGMKGMVVLLDGRVAAFTFGERLTPDTALIHIEKAMPDVNGLYTYINQQFIQRCWTDTRYINREEDMGVPGIRQAKRSYHPAFMVDKFDVIEARH